MQPRLGYLRGYRVLGFWDLGFRAFRVLGFRFRVLCFGVQGLGFLGFRFRVLGF